MVCSIRAPLARNLLLVLHLIYYGLDAAGSELQVHDHETNSHDVSSKLILCPGKSSQDLWKLANNICITLVSCHQPSELWIWWTNCYILEGTGFFWFAIFWRRIVYIWNHSWFASPHFWNWFVSDYATPNYRYSKIGKQLYSQALKWWIWVKNMFWMIPVVSPFSIGKLPSSPSSQSCSFRAWLTRRAAVLTATAALLTEPKRASCGRRCSWEILGVVCKEIHVCPCMVYVCLQYNIDNIRSICNMYIARNLPNNRHVLTFIQVSMKYTEFGVPVVLLYIFLSYLLQVH